METFIQESQHADENSEHHEVAMFTRLLDKNKITTFQSMNAFIITYLIHYWPSTEICRFI